MRQYYVNMTTGEVTEGHREAVEWFRQGDNVTIVYETSKGVQSLSWEH